MHEEGEGIEEKVEERERKTSDEQSKGKPESSAYVRKSGSVCRRRANERASERTN